MVERMLAGVEVRLGVDYLDDRQGLDAFAERVIYTGAIDAFFGYRYGELEYRSLRFESEVLDTDNYQGVAVMNFTDGETPFTRVIEHKHFEFGEFGALGKTVISREFPMPWARGDEPYYPVNDDANNALYEKYRELAASEGHTVFGGRLGEYRYYDMDQVIESALRLVERELV